MEKVEALSFDAYGTLFRGTTQALRDLFAEVIESHRLQATVDGLLRRREELIRDLFTRPFVNMHDRDYWIISTILQEQGVERDAAKIARDLNASYYEAEPYPDALAVLLELSKAYPLAITSNADIGMLDGLLRHNGAVDLFKVIVTSEGAKCYKPARPIFDLTVRGLATRGDAILHVGDSLVADVAGAKAAGLQTCWIDREGGLPHDPLIRPDHRMGDLKGLPALLSGEPAVPG
ncbi:MAG: HAD family hydrolase [Euryarchaeota archaeon]|nr:HAD family hydrolase [Euryarchaeota archaeon]